MRNRNRLPVSNNTITHFVQICPQWLHTNYVITAVSYWSRILQHNCNILTTGGGVDYISGPYNVTFPAGVTTVSFDVLVTNDVIMEDNENFNLTIDPFLPSGIHIVNLGEAKITILDDDGK